MLKLKYHCQGNWNIIVKDCHFKNNVKVEYCVHNARVNSPTISSHIVNKLSQKPG